MICLYSAGSSTAGNESNNKKIEELVFKNDRAGSKVEHIFKSVHCVLDDIFDIGVIDDRTNHELC